MKKNNNVKDTWELVKELSGRLKILVRVLPRPLPREQVHVIRKVMKDLQHVVDDRELKWERKNKKKYCVKKGGGCGVNVFQTAYGVCLSLA